MILDPPSHGLHIFDEPGMIRCRPHEGRHRIHVFRAENEITCGRTGLQQRLELPGLGPTLVIAHMRGDGAHQGTLLSLRT